MGFIKGPNIIRSNLILCVDAGDRNSYSGSGTNLFDIAGNLSNFSLGCYGTSCTVPSFTNNYLSTSFDLTKSNFLDCLNESSVLNSLLYDNHTLEITCKIRSLVRGIDLDATKTNEIRTSILVWQGYHSGLTLDNTYLWYDIWNSTTGAVSIITNITSFVNKVIMIHAVRLSNVLYL